MAHYIDLCKVKIVSEKFFDENEYALISVGDVRRALLMAPVEDVAPRAEIERLEGDLIEERTRRENAVNAYHEQKAEIERLQAVHADMIESLRLAAEANKDMQAAIEKLRMDRYQLLPDGRVELIPRTDINAIKAEAIKVFAQRLKKKMYPYNGVDKKKYAINAYAVEQAIECIAKEMTEGNNESKST